MNYERFGRADNSLCEYTKETDQDFNAPDSTDQESSPESNGPTIPEEIVVEELILSLPISQRDYTLLNSFNTCPITGYIQDPDYSYPNEVFIDENISNYREEILKFAQIGIVDGYEDGRFKPLREMTRTEFLKVALISHCYEYQNEDPSSLPYTDVDQTSWQARVIKKAQDLGMINGDITES